MIRKNIICVIMLLLTITFIFSCSPKQNKVVPKTYTLNITSINGSVSISPDKEEYEEGEEVTLTAYPDSKHLFDKWSGDIDNTDNPATIIMDGDKAITANYIEDKITLKINIIGNGNVSISPDKEEYEEGEEVTLTAYPDSKHLFDKWSGDIDNTDNPATITMNGDKSITATFLEDKITLTINIEGSGNVEISPDKSEYEEGEEVTLTATSDTGYLFYRWSGEVLTVESTITITMNEDKTLTATFLGENEVIVFPDANLEAAIRNKISKPSGDIYFSDVYGINDGFDFASKGINNIAGIEYCVNIISLYLYNNTISDISALSGLTQLTNLGLSDNLISNISSLSTLTNLKFLNIANNSINDISALSKLIKLINLNIENNLINNVDDLSELINLTSLCIGNNNISNIDSLAELSNLSSLLIHNNSISDISILSRLTNLQQLYCFNNNISDISSVAGLLNLSVIDFGDNNINDISAIKKLVNLTRLYLNKNNISDITPLLDLINLNNLTLSGNDINDVNPIKKLNSLTSLSLNQNNISDISALSGLINLTKLYLFDNSISDINALSGLTNLSILCLHNNLIGNLDALSGLTNLTSLDVEHNGMNIDFDVPNTNGIIVKGHILNGCLVYYINGNNVTGSP